MIARLHAWAVAQPGLHTFAIVVRVMLALAFVPSGLVKIVGESFTTLPVSDPVGQFFAGFVATGVYYRFVGVAQWLASALLFVPRTATIGALVYLPISLNIFAITLAIGPSFGGTRLVTGAMLAANVFLVCWDWDRWKGIVPNGANARARHGSIAVGVALLSGAGLAFTGLVGVHLARLRGEGYLFPLATLAAGGLVAFTSGAVAYRRARTQRTAPSFI